jgi:PAS domain S-box-containing protein
MSWGGRRSIKGQLVRVMILTSGMALLVSCLLLLVERTVSLYRESLDQVETAASFVAANSVAALSFADRVVAEKVLATVDATANIGAAVLYDSSGRVFALYASGEGQLPEALSRIPMRGSRLTWNTLFYSDLVDLDGEVIARVVVCYNLLPRYVQLAHYLALQVGVLSGVLGLAWLLAGRLHRVVSNPILNLGQSADQISQRRDYSVRIQPDGLSEIAALVQSFNHLLAQVEAGEKALRESEERYRLLATNASDVFTRMDKDGRVIYVSPRCTTLLGFEASELVGRLARSMMPQVDADMLRNLREDLVSGRRLDATVEHRMVCKDGSMVWVESSVRGFRRGPGEEPELVIVTRDISHRKRIEESLRQYEARLRLMSSELVLAEERERRQLAVDLHDSIGQMLAALRIRLDIFVSEIGRRGRGDEMKEIQSLLEQIISHTRSLTFLLSPPTLYTLGLEAALGTLVEQYQQAHGIAVHLDVGSGRTDLPEDLRVLLFRAVRELLVNVAKHANATEASIRLSHSNGTLHIEVRDNGVGLNTTVNPSSRDQKGFGLFSIQERLQGLGGSMLMESAPGHGTCITLVAPQAR